MTDAAEAKAEWDQIFREELNTLWQRACERAGRQVDPAVENIEQWLDLNEISNYRALFPPADRAH